MIYTCDVIRIDLTECPTARYYLTVIAGEAYEWGYFLNPVTPESVYDDAACAVFRKTRKEIRSKHRGARAK